MLSEQLIDVSLREGSQQVVDLRSADLPTKLRFLELILAAGIKRVELTAFAPGEWFSDADEIVKGAQQFSSNDVELRALYFNVRGLERMLGYKHILPEGVFHTAATSIYREKNYNQVSKEDVLIKLDKMLDAFDRYSLKFDVLQMSTAWGEQREAVGISEFLDLIGLIVERSSARGFVPSSLTLSDTVGLGTPDSLKERIVAVRQAWPDMKIRAHLHPAPGTALSLVHASIEAGVHEWEATWAGLGGSPLATEAGGNLDIRCLIKAFEEQGLETGLKLDAVSNLIEFLQLKVSREILKV